MTIDTHHLPHGAFASTIAPAEACTDLGCDADDDGGVWLPAPLHTLAPPMAIAAALVACAAGLIFGADLAAWMLAALP